jgi:hypothetical protein
MHVTLPCLSRQSRLHEKYRTAQKLSNYAIKVGHDVVTAWRVYRGDQAGPAVPARRRARRRPRRRRAPLTHSVLFRSSYSYYPPFSAVSHERSLSHSSHTHAHTPTLTLTLTRTRVHWRTTLVPGDGAGGEGQGAGGHRHQGRGLHSSTSQLNLSRV